MTSTPAAVAASADQVPRGQRAPLDEFRPLLIDRSAELVESSLPVRGRTWRRSREHQSLAHSANSHLETHLEALFVDTHCGFVSIFTSRFTSLRRHLLSTHLALHVEAIMPCWHLHRQLAPLTHLGLRVDDHCRSSFFVDSSRFVWYPLSLCLVSLFTLHCWAAADLDTVLVISGSGGARSPSWALVRLLQALLHTRSQILLCIVRSVADSFFLVSHRLL